MDIERGTVDMCCRIILLLIGLGELGSYSNAAPISGLLEECCSRCYLMGLTSPQLCVSPPCDRWKLNEQCATVFDSSGGSSFGISDDDTVTNNLISLALQNSKKSPSFTKEYEEEEQALKRLVEPQLVMSGNYRVYPKAAAFKSNYEQLPSTNTIANPDNYFRNYGLLGNRQIRTYFPHHRLFENKPIMNARPEPNEVYFKVILPFPAKDFLTMALRLFYDRQLSHTTSESPASATYGNISDKIEGQINVTADAMQTKGINSANEQSDKLEKEKGSNFTFWNSDDLRGKLVSKRSAYNFQTMSPCCNANGNRPNSRLRGRNNARFSISRSDGCGISASAAHDGSSFAFGNGQIIHRNIHRIPTVPEYDFPELPDLPQLPAFPSMPKIPDFPFF